MPRRSRRCKYDPAQVVQSILSNPLLFRVCELLFSSDRPLHSSEVGRELSISQGYAYTILSRLEKWGVLEPLRDPKNGKSMFRPSSKRVSRLLTEEIKKRKVQDVVVSLSVRKREEDI